jgi:hypothetical protein
MDWKGLLGGGKARGEAKAAADRERAASWLHASNEANARAWALGQQRRFEVDQEEGRLTLFFADGKMAILPVQIIASFLPADRNVRWAWAIDSVDAPLAEAAAALRRYGEAEGIAALKRPELTLEFETLVQYAALAASFHGCAGLFRCLREDRSTVLVGFGAAELQSREGKPIVADTLWRTGRSSPEFEARAQALVEAWDSEMFPIDRDFERTRPADPDAEIAAMDSALDAKDRVYERYWRPKTEQWRPCSFAWPSDHDPVAHVPTLAVPRRGGGCYVVRWPGPRLQTAYVVEERQGELRITDVDLNWGAGMVWIGTPG